MTSHYIGSGNKTSTFNRKPKIPFSKIKNVYGEQLERFSKNESPSGIQTNTISEENRKLLKEQTKKILLKQRNTTIMSLVGTIVVVFLILVIVLNYFFKILL